MQEIYQNIIEAKNEIDFSTRLRGAINEDVDALVDEMIAHEKEHQSFRNAIATKYVNQPEFVKNHGGGEELLATTEHLISFFTPEGYQQFVNVQKADMLVDDINSQQSKNNVIVKVITQKAVIDYAKQKNNNTPT